MTECIHGLDDGLCDICFPKKVPEAVAGAPTRSRSTRVSGTRQRAPRTREPEAKSIAPFTSRRIHHITHLKNLEAILRDGAIVAGATPEFELLNEASRERRAHTEVHDGETLAAFVPFSLTPNPTWWDDLLRDPSDERWSPPARTAVGTQFVQLVGTVAAAGEDVVVSDVEASAFDSRFGVGVDAAASLIRRASLTDPELHGAEVLVPQRYAIDDVVLLAAPNEPVRDRVRAMLKGYSGTAPKVVVYPPWFQPIVEED